MRDVVDTAISTLSERHPDVLRMLTHPVSENIYPMRGIPTDRIIVRVARAVLALSVAGFDSAIFAQ